MGAQDVEYGLARQEDNKLGVGSVPGSLAEAMHAFDDDCVVRDALGEVVCDAFGRTEWAEVEEYRTRVTDWEVSRYLEIA